MTGPQAVNAVRDAARNARESRFFPGVRGMAAIAGGACLVLVVALFAILEGDVPEATGDLIAPLLRTFHRFGHLSPIALLYLEESGVPLPLPGDVFVMYVGRYLPHHPLAWAGAWAALVVVVVLGASNLFWLSRRFGTRLPEYRLGRMLHVTPARIARAQRWFDRYGALALIFGRHIPGFRVPLTIAAGVCGLRYRTFAASVAISTAIWVGVFLYLGIVFGGRLEHQIRLHRHTYFVLPAAAAVLLAVLVARRLIRPSERVKSKS